MSRRSIARVRRVIRNTSSIGLPEAVSGIPPVPMPPAAWVVIERTTEGFFAFRYDQEGEFAGDTWHQTENEAQEQLVFEYDLDQWISVPDTMDDPITFAMRGNRN